MGQTYTPMSFPDPGLRPIGIDWVEHGYQITPDGRDYPEPCPICGAPAMTCVGHAEGFLVRNESEQAPTTGEEDGGSRTEEGN